MKKSLLFGFAAAMTLASCTTNDEILGTAEQTAMEFGSFVNKSTKAPITTGNITSSQFAVWGYKYKTTGTPADIVTVFDNVPVKYDKTVTPNAWIYNFDGQPLRYWDKTCTYDFYAYAPKENVSATALKDATTTTLTIKDFFVNQTPSASADADGDSTKYLMHTDLLIADAIENKVDYVKQNFTFHHVLTNVSINVKKKKDFAGTVTFKSATLRGVTNSAISYMHTFKKATTPETASTWFFSKENSTADFKSGKPSGAVITETGIALFTEMLMIPQKIAENTFDIVYTINGEEYSKTLSFAGTWVANQKLVYNIEISATAIEFGVTTVADWVTQPTVTPTID